MKKRCILLFLVLISLANISYAVCECGFNDFGEVDISTCSSECTSKELEDLGATEDQIQEVNQNKIENALENQEPAEIQDAPPETEVDTENFKGEIEGDIKVSEDGTLEAEKAETLESKTPEETVTETTKAEDITEDKCGYTFSES